MTLGEDVAVAAVQYEIVRSVLGRPGVCAAHRNADNKDHKADQDSKNLLRLVAAYNALTYTKHGTVMTIHCDIAESVLGLPGVCAAQKSADNEDSKADQETKNLLRLVEVLNALTYTKHGTVTAIHCEIVESVLGLPGVRAAQPSVDNKDHKADHESKNLPRLVEAQNALTCTKHGSVMPVNELIAN